MTPLLLALLAILDAAFAGFRAAAGRNARIFKRDYYARSMCIGACAGALLVAGLSVLTALLLVASSDARWRYSSLVLVGEHMLWVFLPYAGLVLGALVVYVLFNHDLRVLATVAILGPFTLARPWIIAIGTLVGLSATVDIASKILTVIASSGVVLLGAALDRYAARWFFPPAD